MSPKYFSKAEQCQYECVLAKMLEKVMQQDLDTFLDVSGLSPAKTQD
jgi:hypothetical protein